MDIQQKEIKCPVCNTLLKEFRDMNDKYHVRVGCVNCKWTTFLADPEIAWEEAKELISKFPPIMRVREGDSINYLARWGEIISDAKIREIDHQKCIIITSRGTCHPNDVLKWPWELEQKGGSHEA